MPALIAAVVLVGALTYPVAGQTEPVELQLKYQRAETLYYHVVQSTVVSTELQGKQTTVTTNREGRLALRVLDVDAEGAMVVETVTEDLRVTTDGRTTDEVDTPVVSKIRPDGTVVEVQGSEDVSTAMDFAIGFPPHPLRAGDTWGTRFDRQLLGMTIEVNATVTLASAERTDAGQIAHVRLRVEGRLKRFNPPRRQEVQIQATGIAQGSGEEIWSVERGRLLQSRSETTLDGHITGTAGGRTVRGHLMLHETTRIDELPRDRVVVSVGQDSLIAPGKAVGAFALDERLEDVVKTLGSPGPGASGPDPTMWGADRGFRSAAASWPNRLVAYLDPQNQSAVLGLGVADRRFRTDKGLGFGSSRGAVLFAHGMSPTRLNMAFRSGLSDTVLVLIYNDEGIAYGIAAEGQPSAATRSGAPLGTVRWVVIFPPGSAGKIFPLP